MRIGTITLHAGFNEGAILQSLALHTAISELRPAGEVEIVDHRYPRLMAKLYGPANDGRKRALQAVYDEQLPLSKVRFYSERHKATFSFINDKYDVVVVGSDEVWKINFQRRLRGLLRLQTDPYSPAFPNAFWPDSSIRSQKIAYAATVGEKTAWSTFSKRMRREIATRLNGFEAIGVRDERTRAFALWADPSLDSRVCWTPDPTFIADLSRARPEAEVKELLVRLGVDFTRPRALIIAGDHPIYAEAIHELRSRGLQTVSVSDFNPDVELDLTKAGIGPLEWAGLARHFNICLSERMHGCIFAILNRTPLICLDRRRATQGFPTKNSVIVSKLGLEEQYVSVHDKGAREKLLDLCGAWATIGGNTGRIDEATADFREIGRSFLDGVLLREPQ